MENQIEIKSQTSISNARSTNDFVDGMVSEIGIFKTAQTLAKSSMLPMSFREPANVVIAMDLAARTGISFFAITNSINIIQGRPSWNSTAVMSMLKNYYSRKGLTISHKFIGDREKDNWGCYVVVTNNDGVEVERGSVVDMKLAKAEGWVDKPGSKWKTMPEQMLIYRAYTFFARVAIPDLLMGFNHTTEELEDIQSATVSKMKTVNPFEENDGVE